MGDCAVAHRRWSAEPETICVVSARWATINYRKGRMMLTTIAIVAAFVIGYAAIATAYNEGADKRFRWSPPILMGMSIMLGMYAGHFASAGEAGTATTVQQGVVHEHAVGDSRDAQAPPPSSNEGKVS